MERGGQYDCDVAGSQRLVTHSSIVSDFIDETSVCRQQYKVEKSAQFWYRLVAERSGIIDLVGRVWQEGTVRALDPSPAVLGHP